MGTEGKREVEVAGMDCPLGKTGTGIGVGSSLGGRRGPTLEPQS